MPGEPTVYPFPIPPELRTSLPATSDDGNWYVDVRVRDAWDGILVIDPSFHCIGIYVHQSIKEYPLPFKPEEIQALRAACLLHRALALLPAWLSIWTLSVLGIVLVAPVILVVALRTMPLLALLNVPVILASWIGMYACPGFPLFRLPIAILGLILLAQSLTMLWS